MRRNPLAALLVIIPTVTVTTVPACAFEISNRSRVALVVVGERFTSPAIWQGHYRCGLPEGRSMDLYYRTFFVRRKGGECWRCPVGYKRALLHFATGPRACKRVLGGGDTWAKASYLKKARKGCPSNVGWTNFRSWNNCYSCPSGFYHNKLHPPDPRNAFDLTRRKRACLPKSYFYQLVRPGATVRGAYQKRVYNLSGKPYTRLRFSVYDTRRKCGWHGTPRMPKGAAPLSPQQAACEVVSFFMKANERATVGFNGITARVTVHRHSGAAYKMYCKPPQPPDHNGGMSCSASVGPVKQYQY